MTLAGALLFGVLFVLWLAPSALTSALQWRIEPQATLTAWLLLVTSTFLTLVAAVVISLLPGTARQSGSGTTCSTAGWQ